MWIKDVLRFVGLALAISLVAIVIVVLVAWFVLDWRTPDKISEALFWSAFIVGGLLFLVTPKHAYGTSVADAKLRLVDSQVAGYALMALVGAIMIGASVLADKVF